MIVDSDASIVELIEEREMARQAGDWQRADEIRQELTRRGVAVQGQQN